MDKLPFKDPEITKEQAIKRAGNASALAKLLGVSRATVSEWQSLPIHQAYRVAQIFPDLNK